MVDLDFALRMFGGGDDVATGEKEKLNGSRNCDTVGLIEMGVVGGETVSVVLDVRLDLHGKG